MQMGGGLTDPFMAYGGDLPMADIGKTMQNMFPKMFERAQLRKNKGAEIPNSQNETLESEEFFPSPYNPLLDNGQIVQTPDDLLYPGNASTNNQPINTTAPYAAKKAIPSLGAKGAKGLGANPLNKEDDKYWSPEVDKGYKSGSSTEERFKSRFAKDRTGKPSFNFSLPNFMNSLGYLSGNILSLLGSGATMQTMYPSSLSYGYSPYGYSPYGNMGFGFGMNPYMYGQQYENRAYGGGIDNPGFRALPDYVQEKIKANMATGGCMECGGKMQGGGYLNNVIDRMEFNNTMDLLKTNPDKYDMGQYALNQLMRKNPKDKDLYWKQKDLMYSAYKNYMDEKNALNKAAVLSKYEPQPYPEFEEGGYLDEAGEGKWIQKATASIKRRGTEGVCTGSKFGSSSCPPGSKRYNLAKTFRKMAKSRKKEDGGTMYQVGDEIDITPAQKAQMERMGYTFE